MFRVQEEEGEVTGIKDAISISRAHLPRLLDKIDWCVLNRLIQDYFNLHILPKTVENEETSYYISNCTVDENQTKTADDLVGAVRKHWGVESNN